LQRQSRQHGDVLRANVAGMYRLVFVVGGRLARDVNQFRWHIDR